MQRRSNGAPSAAAVLGAPMQMALHHGLHDLGGAGAEGDGGYTIKVSESTYRIEIELHGVEALAKRPDPTHINNGDLDPGRDFVITIRPGPR